MNGLLLNLFWTNRFERLVGGSIIEEVDKTLSFYGIKFNYRLVDVYNGEDSYLLTVYCRDDSRPIATIVDRELDRIRRDRLMAKKYMKDEKD